MLLIEPSGRVPLSIRCLSIGAIGCIPLGRAGKGEREGEMKRKKTKQSPNEKHIRCRNGRKRRVGLIVSLGAGVFLEIGLSRKAPFLSILFIYFFSLLFLLKIQDGGPFSFHLSFSLYICILFVALWQNSSLIRHWCVAGGRSTQHFGHPPKRRDAPLTPHLPTCCIHASPS